MTSQTDHAEDVTLACNACGREVTDCPITCVGDFPHGYRVIGDQLWQCACGNRHLFDDGDHIQEE